MRFVVFVWLSLTLTVAYELPVTLERCHCWSKPSKTCFHEENKKHRRHRFYPTSLENHHQNGGGGLPWQFSKEYSTYFFTLDFDKQKVVLSHVCITFMSIMVILCVWNRNIADWIYFGRLRLFVVSFVILRYSGRRVLQCARCIPSLLIWVLSMPSMFYFHIK